MKRLKLLLAIALGSLALLCLWWRWPAYQAYKQERDLNRARGFLAEGDLANASLSARQALQINDRNLEACRLMARLSELARSPAVIDWRARLLELEPTITNRLALVAAALRWGRPPYSLAAELLRQLEPAADALPSFQVLSAELALKLNRLDEAGEHFRTAARLQPDNPLHQLNLAVVELQSTDASITSQARRALEQLSSNGVVDAFSLRALATDDLRRNQLSEAERHSKRLLRLPEATFEDQLQRLTILRRLATTELGGSEINAEFSSRLMTAQRSARTNTVGAFGLCEWMASHGLAQDGLEWLAGLDERQRKAEPLRLARANLYLAIADWLALDRFLSAEKWTDLEFMRLSLLARASWEQGQTGMGDTRWRGAVRAAGDHLGCLTLLLGLAEDWRRDPEEVLWQISRRFPREEWALRGLERLYISTGNTVGLNKVYARLIEENGTGSDATNRNDFACTSLLLGINLAQAHEIARKLHREHPEDVIIASTYAYSLHLQGRSPEGVAIMARFSEPQLRQPQIALYYGVLLANAGQGRRAAPYLELAQGVRLSPEEQRLLDEMKVRLEAN
ncbi:MAG TPA: hypothetical protein VFE51_07335 [Verrucomicrobiae bacterium]|nr:hypothetical protein [Verrucomicrobiae bacterium]